MSKVIESTAADMIQVVGTMTAATANLEMSPAIHQSEQVSGTILLKPPPAIHITNDILDTESLDLDGPLIDDVDFPLMFTEESSHKGIQLLLDPKTFECYSTKIFKFIQPSIEELIKREVQHWYLVMYHFI